MTFNTDSSLATSLAADPFTSLAVHYGMLLGVADFEVLAANARGKLRLHQAWQHGPGVVWGYEPSVEDDSTLLAVSPGLAVDGVGREVASSGEQCVDVVKWLAEHEDDPRLVVAADGRFDAEIWLRHRACLARPVPAMSSTCEGDQREVEFSRVLETAVLELRPGVTADDRDAVFAGLRTLLRDGDVGVTGATGWLDAFRAVAAAETIAAKPPAHAATSSNGSRLFPEDEPGEILLARVTGARIVGADAAARLEVDGIDVGVRRSHVPTWVLSELLAEALVAQAVPPGASGGGPRVVSVTLAGAQVTVTLDTEVLAGTVDDALTLTTIDRSDTTPAWSTATIGSLDPQPGPPGSITFDLPNPPTADVSYRLVMRGTGPTPLLGAGDPALPLAGRAGSPPASAATGADVAVLFVPGSPSAPEGVLS